MVDTDPRIRRTRQLLQQSLATLLQTKAFDKISVQDIADAATVNRVTFYDHYPDKFALLQCVVANRFQELLRQRQITFDGSCSSALNAIVLSVFDYLARPDGICTEGGGRMEPYLESAIIAVVRDLFLEGFRQHPPASKIPPEMAATTLSWAIYGAAQMWVRTTDRPPSEEIVPTILPLLRPMLEKMHTA